MRRHGRQAGGVETGFVSCIRDGDLFALGGDEAVAALKKIRDKCNDSTLHFTINLPFSFCMCNCASKNFKFLKLHFYCEIYAMHIKGRKLSNVTIRLQFFCLRSMNFVDLFIIYLEKINKDKQRFLYSQGTVEKCLAHILVWQKCKKSLERKSSFLWNHPKVRDKS